MPSSRRQIFGPKRQQRSWKRSSRSIVKIRVSTEVRYESLSPFAVYAFLFFGGPRAGRRSLRAGSGDAARSRPRARLASQPRSCEELLQVEEGVRRGAEALRGDRRRQSKLREDRRGAVDGRSKQCVAVAEQG